MIAEISGFFLYIFSLLVYRTCRIEISGLDQIEILRERNEPVILTSWHGMTMMVAALMRKQFDITSFAVIMPDDHRGDVLEVFARWLGIKAIPLNLAGDSTLSMARRLVGLLKMIDAGSNFLIHPDGPAGPAYKVKSGVSFIAQKTGTRILPLGCYCRNAYHIHRWDRYTLPLPFSKVHIQLGELIEAPEKRADLEGFNRKLEDTLNRLTFQAAANYYEL